METNKQEIEYPSIREELSSIENKGYSTFIIPNRTKRDKRQFVKIHIKAFNNLVFNTEVDRKYINFFILLVGVNCNYIEADTNVIRLSIKEIADNMGYSVVHTYNTLNILKKLNYINFYKLGKNKYVVINPKYFAKFYNPRYMYAVEYSFENKEVNLQNLIGHLSVLEEIKKEHPSKKVKVAVGQFVRDNFVKNDF